MSTFKVRRNRNRGRLEVDAGSGWVDWKNSDLPPGVRAWLDSGEPSHDLPGERFPERVVTYDVSDERHEVAVVPSYSYTKDYPVLLKVGVPGVLSVKLDAQGVAFYLSHQGQVIDTWFNTPNDLVAELLSVCEECGESYWTLDDGCDACANDPRKVTE